MSFLAALASVTIGYAAEHQIVIRFDPGGDSPNPHMIRFLRYLADCHRQFALKYVNHGARLGDLIVLTKLPMIERGYEARVGRIGRA